MTGGARPKAGRKAIKINLGELERLCQLQPTDAEIASFFKVSVKTIERRKKQPAFAAAMERGKAQGWLNVRRLLFAQAAKGNVAASIFLAKNILGYRDMVNTELTGAAGGPIQIASKPDLSQLSDEEIRLLHIIAGKTKTNG